MWRSPGTDRGVGRKYTERDLAALIYPVDIILDTLRFSSVREVLNEPILQRMEKDELVFALYEVFQALLSDLPVPKGEHPGYQEAIIAELLLQMHASVELECVTDRDAEGSLEDYDPGGARRAAWTSYISLCHPNEEADPNVVSLVERLGLDLSNPKAHLSPKLTSEMWERILVSEGLFDEFLWDTDWRLEKMLDLPEESSRQTRELMGYDLETVHRLPPSPSREEFVAAELYLRKLGRFPE